MTPSMIERARHNAAKGNYGNVEFHLATIDRLPLPDNSVDCVISNCVINLAPDKPAVFREIFRVLKPGGRLAASDIALKKDLPAEITNSIAAYVGCIAGAIHVADYQTQLQAAGFDSVAVIDSGKDLNAYAKVENQSGCCSPAMDETSSPFKIASSGCCGGKSTELHTDLKMLLDNYDVNDAAASVRVFALKPAHSGATFIRASRPEDRPFIDALLQTENLPLTGLDRAQGWVAEFGGQIIGHIALEGVKDAVVLRSLVVTPARRGKGLARRLLAQAECAAGSRVVALRTKTVGPWIERLGYCRIDSIQLPKSLLDTSEFSGTLCSGFPIYLKGGAVTLPQTHKSNSCCGKQSAEKCRD
jgi:N-acetylglutamate synthase-like GNAT family acetyltransferase